MRRSVAGTVAALVVVAGCSSGGDSDPGTSSTGSSTSASSASPSVTPAQLPKPIGNDAPSHPLEDSLRAVQRLPGDPDWLALAAGHLWVKRDDGRVS